MDEITLADARAVVYYHSEGVGWTPPPGAGNQISRVRLLHDKARGTYRFVGATENNGVVTANTYVAKGMEYIIDNSQPKFHKFRDNTRLYGLNFVQTATANVFKDAFKKALKAAKKGKQVSKPAASAHAGGKSDNDKTMARTNTTGNMVNKRIKTQSTNFNKAKAMFGNSVGNRNSVGNNTVKRIDSPTSSLKQPPKNFNTIDSSKLRAINGPQKGKQMQKSPRKYGALRKSPTPSPRNSHGPKAGAPVGPKKVSFGVRAKRSLTANAGRAKVRSKLTTSAFTQSQTVEENKINKTAPPPTQAKKPKKPNAAKRKQIVEEFLKTEQDYVGSLTLLRELYYLPLKACPRLGLNIISMKDVGNIFYGFDAIFNVNEEMLREFQMAKFANQLDNSLGKIMAKFAQLMILYVDYVNKYNLAVETINRCKGNKVFTSFLAKTSQEPLCKHKTIGDYLIMPIQRVPRYKMLLMELKKNTETHHVDYNNILEALDKISSIATNLNSKKAEYEKQEKVQQIQEQFDPKTPAFFKENRTYIKHTYGFIVNKDFKVPTKAMKKKKRMPEPEELALTQCILVLFSDIIVWGTPGKRAQFYEMRERLKLDTIVAASEKPKYKPSFYDYQIPEFPGFSIDTNDRSNVLTIYFTKPGPVDTWKDLILQQSKVASEEKMKELQRRHNLSN